MSRAARRASNCHRYRTPGREENGIRLRPRDEGDARMTERPQKITFGEMRESGVVLVYCPMIFAGNPR